jgi:hypothetical protein
LIALNELRNPVSGTPNLFGLTLNKLRNPGGDDEHGGLRQTV